MLVSLHVKNLALIEECEVFWKDGLNILTGETGAGKSIILGSVRLALGEALNSVMGNKNDKDCIRTGAEYALVELTFETKKEDVLQKMEEYELPLEEGTIFIQRKIMSGRSVCKINGETVTAKQLKELASMLIAIHGQHDTQTLLNVKKHSQILDEYAGKEVADKKEEMKAAYEAYRCLKNELEEMLADSKNRDRDISLAEFEVNEIESAALVIGEDEELEVAYKKMNNAKKIAESVSKAYQATGYDGENAAGMAISYALRELKSVSSLDLEMEEMEETLLQIDSMLNDFNRSASGYLDSLEFSPEEYRQVEERLNTYNHLKNKYGKTVQDVLAYLDKQSEKLEKLADIDAYIENLTTQLEEQKEVVYGVAKELSGLRKQYAVTLQKELEEALVDLNFIHAEFEVSFSVNEEKLTAEGYDEIEFMISLNPGEPKKLLSNVASGGELSRIMLALKAIMAEKEQTETLIFDEIDSGISGKTAWKVSEKMAVLGKFHQLICITHLPQIAAMSDSHYLIEKTSDVNSTVTDIKSLQEEESLMEIARLLGSEQITEAVLANAKELKDMATKTKTY